MGLTLLSMRTAATMTEIRSVFWPSSLGRRHRDAAPTSCLKYSWTRGSNIIARKAVGERHPQCRWCAPVRRSWCEWYCAVEPWRRSMVRGTTCAIWLDLMPGCPSRQLSKMKSDWRISGARRDECHGNADQEASFSGPDLLWPFPSFHHGAGLRKRGDRKSTRLNSSHT